MHVVIEGLGPIQREEYHVFKGGDMVRNCGVDSKRATHHANRIDGKVRRLKVYQNGRAMYHDDKAVTEGKYNSYGRWTPSPVKDGKGGSGGNLDEKLRKALEQIDKTFGKKKEEAVKDTVEKPVEEAYSKTAVDKSIKSSRKKIGGKEARLIHALLKGRQKEDEPVKESLNEGLRLMSTHNHENGIHSAKVYKDSDFNEYRTKFFINGKHMGEDSDDFQSTHEDAKGTAEAGLKHMAKHNVGLKESADDFKASGYTSDQNIGKVTPPEIGRTLADYVNNVKPNPAFSPLLNFLKAHKVEVEEPNTSDPSVTADMFNAASTPTYDRATHRQGNDEEQTNAAYDAANPDNDEWQMQARIQKAREKAYIAMHDLWKGERD